MDDAIGGSVIVHIPTVGCADWELKVQVEHGLGVIIDRAIKLIITQTGGMPVCLVIVTIKALGSNSDRIDSRFILFGVRMELLDVGIKRFRPVILSAPKMEYRSYKKSLELC